MPQEEAPVAAGGVANQGRLARSNAGILLRRRFGAVCFLVVFLVFVLAFDLVPAVGRASLCARPTSSGSGSS